MIGRSERNSARRQDGGPGGLVFGLLAIGIVPAALGVLLVGWLERSDMENQLHLDEVRVKADVDAVLVLERKQQREAMERWSGMLEQLAVEYIRQGGLQNSPETHPGEPAAQVQPTGARDPSDLPVLLQALEPGRDVPHRSALRSLARAAGVARSTRYIVDVEAVSHTGAPIIGLSGDRPKTRPTRIRVDDNGSPHNPSGAERTGFVELVVYPCPASGADRSLHLGNALEAKQSMAKARLDAQWFRLLVLWIWLGVVVSVACCLTMPRLLRRRMFRELSNLEEVTSAIAEGDMLARLQVPDGHPVAAVARSMNGMLDDIEDRQEHLEQMVRKRTADLTQALEQAESARKAKGDFLATMSHEIRTPLNAVIGASDLVLDSKLSAQQRDLMETVHQSGELLLSILNDILDFSKIEAAKLSLEQRPFDLDLEMEAVMRAMESRARSQGNKLHLEIDPQTPDVLIGDSVRLRQVILNLLSNAVKFTHRGEVRCSVRMLRDGTAPDSPTGSSTDADHDAKVVLEVTVTDTGVGMDEEAQSRLFRAFEQADNSTTRKFGGTGLGLAIASRLVDLMGGVIDVESTKGKGSSFRFTAQLVMPSAEQRRTCSSAAELAGRSILLISDDQVLERLTQRYLSSSEAIVRRISALDACSQEQWVMVDAAVIDGSVGDIPEPVMLHLQSTRTPVIHTGTGNLPPGILAERLPDTLRKRALLEGLKRLLMLRPTSSVPSAVEQVRAPLTKVLVAEDNPVNQKVIMAILKSLRCEGTLAGDGDAAVAAMEKESFDVILMDYQMPKLDGPAAARQIRALEKQRQVDITQQIPIIALTANAGPEFEAECKDAGMDAFLGKPVHKGKLRDALWKLTSHKGRSPLGQ